MLLLISLCVLWLCFVSLQIPEGDWFCGNECNIIKTQLGALVSGVGYWCQR